MELTESDLRPFQFITRVDDSAPLIPRGSLNYFVKRVTKRLQRMKPRTEEEIIAFNRLKIIRDEIRELKNSL